MCTVLPRLTASLFALALIVFGVQLAAAERASALGQLTYEECFSNDGGNLCTRVSSAGTPLNGAFSVATSSDGGSVYVVGRTANTITVFNRSPSGRLTFLECVSNQSSTDECADVPGTLLDRPGEVAVSPDGNSVYVMAVNSSAVSVFKRAPSGRLTYAGCVSNDGSGQLCADVPSPFEGPGALAVSPDGNSVYVAGFSTDTVTVFRRLQPEGQLLYAGCVSNDGSGGMCGPIPGNGTPLFRLRAIAVSPDGKSVFAAGAGSISALSVFNRAVPEGQLSYAECFTDDGSNGCTDMPGDGIRLGGLIAVAVSPDSASVYAIGEGGDDPLNAFRRAPGGQLSPGGCINNTGSNGCTNIPGSGSPLTEVSDIAVSPDGNSVYAAGGSPANAVVTMTRAPGGELSYGGCIGDDASNGCTDIPGDGAPLGFANAVAVSPDGNSVYAGAFTAATLTAFSRKSTFPQTTIDSGPAEGSTIITALPRFSFSADQPGASFECAVDGGAFVPCSSPATIGPLGAGHRNFSVRAVTDGDIDPTPATRSFLVAGKGETTDRTPPTVTLTKFPHRRVQTARRRVKVTFAFTSNELGATFLCKLDKRRLVPCASPKRYKVRRGKHRVTVEAIDAAGNVSAPVSFSFAVVRRKRTRGARHRPSAPRPF
jgi:DNA-binding beta-propeller fold protein YncE